ncbi:MAG: NTP transferase domain-containing protein [Nitrososphaerota archaeon]
MKRDVPHISRSYNVTTQQVIAVVMCGGKGSRMGRREKPLVEVLGKPLISYALNAILCCSAIKGVDFVTSTYTPLTTKYLKEVGYEPFVARGAGFLKDLSEYLSSKQKGEYLIVSCDVPTLHTYHVQAALDMSKETKGEYVVYVLPYEIVKGLSKIPTVIKHEEVEYQPAGLRLYRKDREGAPDLSTPVYLVLRFRELGVNVNTLEDIPIAESFLKRGNNLAKS